MAARVRGRASAALAFALALALAPGLACAPSEAAAGSVEVVSDADSAGKPAPSVFDGSLGGNRGILPVGLDEDGATYVTVARLASADVSLDSSLVSFRGEVVGEAVNSSTPGYRWVLVQSNTGGTSSIEVLMSEEQVALIENFGSYKTRGTTLRITGIYRLADPNQAGELDVTAYAVRVVDPGGPVAEDVDVRFVWAGAALVAVGVALSVVNVYVKRRSRS